ncbi:FMN-binding protein [Microbacterium sp. ASV49]|uniref:FMN-binding protein n=1 Tax=Microbacterium candidum TaxID=3041922 RepID=A0ABT7MZR4_9MICO|nr:FMN-binding protein [Microbacterium sp. ASV49]MDL9979934.1 FMN-binding protein [Microbacterium sp. ASV49]
MKRIVYAVLATVAGLVLLFSYRTSLDVVAPTAGGGTAGGTSTGSSGSSSTGSSSTGSSSSASSGSSGSSGSGGSASSSLKDGTYTGQSTDTRWGPVQVEITVSGGRITAADAVDYPQNNPRDQEINQYAIPQLVSETIQAQSAQIDMVSGATYTSEGYTTSLQSAIDQARA